MKNYFLLALFIVLFHSNTGQAKSVLYRTPVIAPPNTGVKFFVPYTFGTHTGEARMFAGSMTLDNADPQSSRGEFSVPINSMTTDKAERDCHMMEALGLDYGEADFPEEHVCTDSYTLPATGKNAVKYPTILLKIHSVKSLEPSKLIHTDRETKIEVDGEWIIHGKSYQWKFPLSLTPDGEKFKVHGTVPFSLKNHDVIVKSQRVLFVDINVKDNIKVEFNMIIEPSSI